MDKVEITPEMVAEAYVYDGSFSRVEDLVGHDWVKRTAKALTAQLNRTWVADGVSAKRVDGTMKVSITTEYDKYGTDTAARQRTAKRLADILNEQDFTRG